MIDMTKKYQTRDGRKVRLLCTNRNSSEYPVVALIGKDEDLDAYTADGRYFSKRGLSNSKDLIEVIPRSLSFKDAVSEVIEHPSVRFFKKSDQKILMKKSDSGKGVEFECTSKIHAVDLTLETSDFESEWIEILE